ncbi:MAG TPA: sodium-dependent transporter [Sedimentisphaerales bacterium]|nr:sodium-dependent transporter [Sedimentisphaerales bacterium]
MAELLEEQRESWGTRGGFILAAIGSAVGLGNLWGFPYKLYSYGGGAFLIPYIIALLVVGIPIMVLEFSIGHYTQRAAPDAFKRGHRRFEMVGWWGIVLAFVIVTYYPVILAYCFSFLWYSIVGIFNGGELPWAGEGIEGVKNAKSFFNDTYLGKIDIEDARFYLGSIRWNIVWPLLITWAVMYFCIFKGVRLVGKIVWLTVPLPWLMLLILTVRGLTLEGSMQGLTYYLDPVWSELAKPITWRYAFGQVFFSLSLAYGIMITYASFLHRKSDINNNAAIISIADFATSFVAGLAVFATLGGMAFVTQLGDNPVAVEQVAETGPSLAFVAFPYALAQLPYSAWFSFVFFFALVTLGVDSAFSMTESILASIIDKTGWRRSIVLPVMSVVGFLFGLFYITEGGFNWLGTIDGFVNGTWGIAFMGLLECVVLGWLWRIGTLRRHANSHSDWKLGKWWDYLIRLVIPVFLGTLFFWQLFDDISGEGFLRTPEGDWILPNCVGLGIVALVPVVAIILSLARGRTDVKEPERAEQGLAVGGRREGAIAFFAASSIAVLLILWLTVPISQVVKQVILWLSLVGGVVTMLLSNYVLDKHHTSTSQASWLARWAGIIAAMDISAAIAIILIGLADGAEIEETTAPIRDKLSGVSYIILTVVFLIIIGGLGWCFYKALAAASRDTGVQHPDEIGDERQRI